ncbi:hypothetical protein V6M85_03200 [Sulfolobus tengchongensis]|uniref:Uncharacterized protein n=2 Tax=Sulfolobus tengchongensis TaxID=207809 RepID=A0AAX4L2K0_9CREN
MIVNKILEQILYSTKDEEVFRDLTQEQVTEIINLLLKMFELETLKIDSDVKKLFYRLKDNNRGIEIIIGIMQVRDKFYFMYSRG